MASDVYAFVVLAWEVKMGFVASLNDLLKWNAVYCWVFAGRAPFSDKSVIARVNSMPNGYRPTRPGHPELSDRVWRMIEGCWKDDPAKRKKVTEVVAVLEAGVNIHKSK